MEAPLLPTEVSIGDQAIVVVWNDGHRSPFPHRYLRLRCPCASCVDEMSGRPRLDPESVPTGVKALDQMPVGNYALQFLWSDTHYTGIYTYRWLRSLCTCIPCNEARGGEESPPGRPPRR
jgi:DUF971 family protein